mgnify:CR=1 FL=1
MEEQKKTQGEAGGDSLFDGGFDTAVPERPWATLKRLWHTAQDQHLRLLVVVLSVVCYTALAIAAPYFKKQLPMLRRRMAARKEARLHAED